LTDGAELGRKLRERDRSAAAPALNLIETRTADARKEAAALLAEVSPAALGGEASAHVVGITGPPGAGKSTLLSALVKEWRSRGRTVAVLAVDPSSKRSGGSLLGDRARIDHDARDDGILIRSTAAGTMLGGLAPPTREAAQALAAAFDVVVVETVGVGQSETDVADLCDTVAVVVQPGSGDVLQLKSDLEKIARRAQRDLTAALRAVGARDTPVVAVSSVPPPSGIDDLADALDAHRASADVTASRVRARRPARGREVPRRAGPRPARLGARQEARGVKQVTALIALFVAVTALAELLGAANLGTAATFGQMAFMLALVYVLVKR
jgi:LAO/AO transport system kinase